MPKAKVSSSAAKPAAPAPAEGDKTKKSAKKVAASAQPAAKDSKIKEPKAKGTAKKPAKPVAEAVPEPKAAAKRTPAKRAKGGAVTPEERHRMISEAAYHLAEHRGFEGGDPHADWLAAEAEIDRRLAAGSVQE